MTRIAVDTVRAGSPAPDVVHGVVVALTSAPDLEVALVGPVAALRDALGGAGPALPADRIELVDAARSVGPDDDPVVVVRGRRDASVRIAVDLLRTGAVDAMVSAGPATATVVAARFSLPRVRGLRAPALAAEVALEGGSVTVVDAGAEAHATAGTLVRYGELGAELARRRGTSRPRVAALAPLGTSSRDARELGTLFEAADLGDGSFVGARSPAGALAGDVDVLVTPGAAGAILVDTVRALRPADTCHAVLVGVQGTVATLTEARPSSVTEALLDVVAIAGRAPTTTP
ncbi:MAG: hypothetical protein KY461_05280 [Actinobacteria bacterium]|nr:hypothetical protein [Actinomycetota bacterium]